MKQLRKIKTCLEKQLAALESQGKEDRRALLAATRSGEQKSSFSSVENEATSLAYVRNVVFNLLTSYHTSSFTSRQAMIKALVMVLRFSREEENALLQGVLSG